MSSILVLQYAPAIKQAYKKKKLCLGLLDRPVCLFCLYQIFHFLGNSKPITSGLSIRIGSASSIRCTRRLLYLLRRYLPVFVQ